MKAKDLPHLQKMIDNFTLNQVDAMERVISGGAEFIPAPTIVTELPAGYLGWTHFEGKMFMLVRRQQCPKK
jgi:hypothetical protein